MVILLVPPLLEPSSALFVLPYSVLIQQMAQSVINNHLPFMMSLLHVLAFTKPSSWRMYTKVYKHSKFCWRCACVELDYSIFSGNCYKHLKYKSVTNVWHLLTLFYLSLLTNICINYCHLHLKGVMPVLSVDVYAVAAVPWPLGQTNCQAVKTKRSHLVVLYVLCYSLQTLHCPPTCLPYPNKTVWHTERMKA